MGRCDKDTSGFRQNKIYDRLKIRRKIKFGKLNKNSAEKKIKQIDKQRAEYYKHFTNQTWGDRNNYDLCIDTSKLGVNQTIDILENYIVKRAK